MNRTMPRMNRKQLELDPLSMILGYAAPSKTGRKQPVVLTADDSVYVGLDVHKNSIRVAVRVNGVVCKEWATSSSYQALAGQLEPYRPALRMVAYEAGPTGFGLARLLESRGLPVMVCATSKMPRAAVAEAKTDRLDARQIAEYAAKDLLRAVTIPTEQEEHRRALIRHRTQLTKSITATKTRIKSAVLYHGCSPIRSWSEEERQRLLSADLSPGLSFLFESFFQELAFLESQRKALDVKLREVLSQKPHAAVGDHLQTHPGVGPVLAAYFLLEMFRPERFKSGEAVARYLGLAPGVRSTGETHRGGPLLKAGQGKLRSVLIEAAWRWQAVDPEARKIYERTLAKTGMWQKAIVALARRLAIRLWKMAIYGESYQPAVKASKKAGKKTSKEVGEKTGGEAGKKAGKKAAGKTALKELPKTA